MSKILEIYLVINLLIGIVMGLLFSMAKEEDSTFVTLKYMLEEIPIVLFVLFIFLSPATILTFLVGIWIDLILLLKYPIRWLMDVNDRFVEWRDNRK